MNQLPLSSAGGVVDSEECKQEVKDLKVCDLSDAFSKLQINMWGSEVKVATPENQKDVPMTEEELSAAANV